MMGQFSMEMTAVGLNCCIQHVAPGEKLRHRCGKFKCPSCKAFDFVQQMRHQGVEFASATFIHWPGTPREVRDDLLRNERASGMVQTQDNEGQETDK